MIFQTDWVSDWTGKKKSVTNWGENVQKNLKIELCETNWGKGA